MFEINLRNEILGTYTYTPSSKMMNIQAKKVRSYVGPKMPHSFSTVINLTKILRGNFITGFPWLARMRLQQTHCFSAYALNNKLYFMLNCEAVYNQSIGLVYICDACMYVAWKYNSY